MTEQEREAYWDRYYGRQRSLADLYGDDFAQTERCLKAAGDRDAGAQ